MLTSFKRIVIFGLRNFSRNWGLSLTTVFVVASVVFLISSLFIFDALAVKIIDGVKHKVDISIYFLEDIPTENIMAVKAELLKLQEVKDVEFIDKEKAMADFIEKHKNDQLLLDSISEVGSNPFLASLSVRAKEAAQYEQISKFLEGDSYKPLINKVDYFERKPVIERLYSITDGVNKGGLFAGIALSIIAILVAFNTVRIAIYSSKDEISVMRLVGATNRFIRGPFLIQGALTGLISALIVLIISFALFYGLDGPIRKITSDISVFNIFIANFWNLIIIQIIVGLGLGTLSSALAVRKYLRV